MFTAKLTRLDTSNPAGTPGDLRTTSVEGTALKLPEPGKCFMIGAKALNPGFDGRMVATSIVREVEEKEDHIIFHTLNSTYKLEIIADLSQEN